MNIPVSMQNLNKNAKRIGINIFSEHLIWVILVILCLASARIPGFFTFRNAMNVLWAASSLGCMVLGMFLVMLTSGVDLSLESTFAFSPAIGVLFMTAWLPSLVNPWVALVITVATGGLIGLLNGLLSVKFKINPFLITLATMMILRGLLVSWIPEGIYYLPAVFLFIGKAKIANTFPVAVIVMIVLYIIGYIVTEKLSIGKAFFAIGNNEHAAFIAGIKVNKVKIIAFILAGCFAAIGGLIETGRISSVIADLGLGSILTVFAAAILGGTSMTGGEGKVTGIFAAVLVLAIIDNMLNLLGIDPSIRQVVQGFVLLSAIILTSMQKRLGLKS
jgi:simple sugar transport system permease protein